MVVVPIGRTQDVTHLCDLHLSFSLNLVSDERT